MSTAFLIYINIFKEQKAASRPPHTHTTGALPFSSVFLFHTQRHNRIVFGRFAGRNQAAKNCQHNTEQDQDHCLFHWKDCIDIRRAGKLMDQRVTRYHQQKRQADTEQS